jgi:Dyp-type peroxidase family
MLGDDGRNHPDGWIWGSPDEPVDAVYMIFASTEKTADDQWDLAFKTAQGITVVAEIKSPDYGDRTEHFGFADGISQPVIIGNNKWQEDAGNNPEGSAIKPGEFLLGYTNEYNQPAKSPRLPPDVPAIGGSRDIGRNGTYLVARHFYQDVAGFKIGVARAAASLTPSPNSELEAYLAAKMVGRFKDGRPLTDPSLGGNNINNFQLRDNDSHGYGCPIGAHIRRANPRDSLGNTRDEAIKTIKRHRLLRRGRSYGPRYKEGSSSAGEERGLVFVALNADIERQFEFIQSAWILSETFDGLHGEMDPLLSPADGDGKFTVPKEPVRQCAHNITGYITTCGGAYFFLPSMSALSYLAQT